MDNLLKLLQLMLTKNVYIPANEWDEFMLHFTKKTLNQGDHYLMQGKIATKIGFLVKGNIKVYTSSDNGNDTIKNFIKEESAILDLSSLILNKPSTHNFIALEECLILEIDYSKFMHFSRKMDSIHILWLSIISKEASINDRRINELLLENANEKFTTFKTQFPEWKNRIPKGEVANYLGINRSTLSRLIKQIPLS